MRNVSDQSYGENQNTHFRFNKFFSENRALYEIMCKNVVEPDRPQMTIWCMRFVCWLTKAIDTLRTCDTDCFSTATMVTCTHLSVTLYVNGLSC